MPITLRQLRDIFAVIEAGSFRAAAERINAHQSAISRGIIEFEACIGAKIFDRHPSGVRLTALGKQLAPDIAAILDSVDKLASKARASSKSGPDQFTLGLDAALPIAYSQPFMAAIGVQFRDSQITLLQREIGEVVGAVREGRSQFGLIRGAALPSGVSYRRFLGGELLGAFPTDWPINAESIEAKLLSNQRLHIAGDDIAADGVANLREVLGPKINLTIHACGASGLIGLVAAGMGVALLTSVPAEAAEMGIPVVPVRPTVPVIGITAIWSPDALPASMTAFLSQLKLPSPLYHVPS